MSTTKYRYFVQTINDEDMLFRWNPETERMEIMCLSTDPEVPKQEWERDIWDSTPSTLNWGTESPEDPYYIHEIDESIVNYKLREAGL